MTRIRSKLQRKNFKVTKTAETGNNVRKERRGRDHGEIISNSNNGVSKEEDDEEEEEVILVKSQTTKRRYNSCGKYLTLLVLSFATLFRLSHDEGIIHHLISVTTTTATNHHHQQQPAAGASSSFSSFSQTAKTSISYYCDQNSTHPSCCNPQQCELIRNSTIYSKCCHNLPTNPLAAKIYPTIITGTPRSGTKFLVEFFGQLGVNITHDWKSAHKGTAGMISWMHIRNDYGRGHFGPGHLRGNKFWNAWHLVRNPLQSLTSIAFSEPLHMEDYLRFLRRHILLDPPDTNCYETYKNDNDEYKRYQCLLKQGLQFYIQWHTYISKLSIRWFQLEELTERHNMTLLDELFKSMDMPEPTILHHERAKQIIAVSKKKKYGNTDKNSRQHRPTLEWWELCQVDVELTQQFLKLGQQFGYYLELTSGGICGDVAMNHLPTTHTQVNPIKLFRQDTWA